VAVAGVEEQLRFRNHRLELASGVAILAGHVVVLRQVDLDGDAVRPGAAELRRRDARFDQQRALCAGPRLGQHLRRQHPERKPA
jgi:hypothetical protein